MLLKVPIGAVVCVDGPEGVIKMRIIRNAGPPAVPGEKPALKCCFFHPPEILVCRWSRAKQVLKKGGGNAPADMPDGDEWRSLLPSYRMAAAQRRQSSHSHTLCDASPQEEVACETGKAVIVDGDILVRVAAVNCEKVEVEILSEGPRPCLDQADGNGASASPSVLQQC